MGYKLDDEPAPQGPAVDLSALTAVETDRDGGADDADTEARTYQDLLTGARDLGEDADGAESIIAEAASLPPLRKRKIHEAIKSSTGLPLSAIAAEERLLGDGDREPDDLDLARELIDEVGRDNLLAVQSFVYQWLDTGVWKALEPRAVRKLVQQSVARRCDVRVGKARVDSVADVFATEVFRPDHQFNVGPVECVNTESGELSLVDGAWTLVPHRRENYRTTQIPVEWNPRADAPRFRKFLAEVFAGDADAGEKAQALLEMIGYSLMAHCRHEKFVILVGAGANGKSVLLAVLEALCGPSNVAGVQPSQFDRAFQRAHMHGKLANVVTEVKQGETIDDASLKGIVSGEPSTVEHKFRDPFTMRPFATCWFGTNHMPHTRDFSDALFRRALVVEFNEVFKPDLGNCDPQLKDKLLKELPGILRLSMESYAGALACGFTMPESCLAAREKWRLEADQVAQFIADDCTADPRVRVEPGILYETYRQWAGACGINRLLTLRSFRDRLDRLGFQGQKSNGRRYIVGLRCHGGRP